MIQVETHETIFHGVNLASWSLFASPEATEVADFVVGKRAWRATHGGSTGGSLGVGSVTTKSDGTLELVRRYYEPKDEPENSAGPFPGFVIWIAEKTNESNR